MKIINSKDIGLRIKQARKDLKLTQETVAKKSGISRSYYADVENGRYSASTETLQKISKTLNVPLSKLLDDREGVEELILGTVNDILGRSKEDIDNFYKADSEKIFEDLLNSIESIFVKLDDNRNSLLHLQNFLYLFEDYIELSSRHVHEDKIVYERSLLNEISTSILSVWKQYN